MLNLIATPIKPVLNQQIGGVPLSSSWDYLGCVWENSFFYKLANPGGINFGEATNIDLFEFCKQDLVGAQEIGCSECFDISLEALNPRVFAGTGQEALVSARVQAVEEEFCYSDLFGERTCQPLTPAANSQITILANENIKAKIEGGLGICSTQENILTCNELDPAIITDTPLTVVGRIDADQFCDGKTRAIDAEATLQYTYRTEGSAQINIRKFTVQESAPFVSTRNPITLPGPVKIDIIPDAYFTENIYKVGLSSNAFLFVKFRNVGEGDASVKNVQLKQILPEGALPLTLVRCAGPIVPIEGPIASDTIDIKIKENSFTLSPTERSGTILCNFALPKEAKDEITTYIITGSAIYDYELRRTASSIIVEVDKDGCEKIVAPTPKPTAETGGIEQIEILE